MLSTIPSSVQIPEGVVILNPEDPIVSGSLAFGIYEPFETGLFRKAVTPGMTIVDIGANIGYYAVMAAGLTGEHGHVIAFEPEPRNFYFLTQSLEKNGFKNTDAHQLAVADKPGTLALNLYEDNKGKHSLVKDRSDAKGFSTSVEVRTVDLDSFLGAHGNQRVDIIKMDIEGAESLALLGMQKALTMCRMLFMEFTPDSIRKIGHDPEAVLSGLAKSGFTLYEIDEHAKSKKLISSYADFVRSIPAARAANLVCIK